MPFNTYCGKRCDHSLTDELNYFSCNVESGGDTRLWIEDQTGFPGLIIAQNDDYFGSGDFIWGLQSRVKQAFNRSIRSGQVTAYSSYAPIKYCDLYLNCKNSNIMSHFENLEPDDAIMSANTNNYTYNCTSWSGGIIDEWCWPPSKYSPWYDPDPLTAFDNFYENNPGRYLGAWNYTRTGATSSNNTVDLWAKSGSYTHASVNSNYHLHTNDLPANEHPHGYDWESKLGSLMRTFHPRNSLNGSNYGNIDKYYRWDGTYYYYDLPLTKLSDNMTINVLETVQLSEEEKSLLINYIAKVPIAIKSEFEYKYHLWKNTWTDPKIAIHSNPKKYAESQEYYKFLNFCQKQGKGIWPFLFKKYEDGDFFIINPLEDLTIPEYRQHLDRIISESAAPRYTPEGAYIVPSLRSNAMKYIKKLIESTKDLWTYSVDPSNEDETDIKTLPDKFSLQQNYPNPFNPVTQIRYGLPSETCVSLIIYDILGREILILINNEHKQAGWHTIYWNGNNKNGTAVSSGVYICRLIAGTRVKNVKINILR